MKIVKKKSIQMPRRHMADVMEPGAILESSWGYEQTNVDYYMVIKRTATSAQLIRMEKKSIISSSMVGTCIPGKPDITAKPFRRKIYDYGNGECVGIGTYSSAHLWDGKPSRWTSYA